MASSRRDSKMKKSELVARRCVAEILKRVEGLTSEAVAVKSSCSIVPVNPKQFKDESLIEDRRLANWKRWLKIRDKESHMLGKATYRRRKDLLLNFNPNDDRAIATRGEILEKTVADFGDLKFWKLPETTPKDLILTLPISQRIANPEIIYTQTPDLILKEQRIALSAPTKTRLKMVQEKFERVIKVEPLVEHLALKGNVIGDGLTDRFSQKMDSIRLSQNYLKFKEVVMKRQQTLVFDGIKVDSSFPDVNILIDVVFEGMELQRQTKTVRVENCGEIAVNLTLKGPAKDDVDVLISSSNAFFFNKTTFRVIPGETINVPFHFYPTQVGVTQELWIVDCFPAFSTDCKIQISLFGHCTEKHNMENELKEIEERITRKAANYDVEQAIKDIIRLTVSDRKPSRRELFEDPNEAQFKKMNPKLNYNLEQVEVMTQIHSEMCEDGSEWNFDINTLYKMILKADESQEIYEKFNQSLNQLKTAKRSFNDDEKCAKFSMVRNIFGIFFEKFEEDDMNDEREKFDVIKIHLCAAIDNMIKILES